MVTAGGYVVSRIPAIGRADTPQGYARRVLQLGHDNDAHRDDNPTMTDDTNGTQNGDASPFGAMKINFGGGRRCLAGRRKRPQPVRRHLDHLGRPGRDPRPARGTDRLHGRPRPHRDAGPDHRLRARRA